MIEKGAGAPMAAGAAANPVAAAPKAAAGPVNEVGVYYLKNDAWSDLAPEVVNFKTGGVLIKTAAGEIIGAAGASGGTGEEDEACCVYGIEQAGLAPDAKE